MACYWSIRISFYTSLNEGVCVEVCSRQKHSRRPCHLQISAEIKSSLIARIAYISRFSFSVSFENTSAVDSGLLSYIPFEKRNKRFWIARNLSVHGSRLILDHFTFKQFVSLRNELRKTVWSWWIDKLGIAQDERLWNFDGTYCGHNFFLIWFWTINSFFS